MPDIAIEQSTFKRLQRYARPLVDTTDMIVNRALDALEQREGSTTHRDDSSNTTRQIDPQTLPNMAHTKILYASLAGERIAKPNWNLLVDRIVVHAMKQLTDFDELQKLCPVNMVQGRKNDEGYRYLADIDASVQGLSANDACGALVIAAQSLRVELQITFVWRPKKGAAYPGEKAQLIVSSVP